MKFTKYHDKGAYHWAQYAKNTKYRTHADRVKEWITEDLILDVGAGDGKMTALLGCVGIDNEPEAVRLAQEQGANVMLGDAYRIPFPSETFDVVLMADALEHLERPVEGLLEARRVLTRALYITTPPKRADGKLTDKFHYQEWTPGGLQELVEACGFVLEGEIRVFPEEKVMYAKFLKK